MTNTENFARELGYITNEDMRNFVSTILETLPDYFRIIGASTSGKYHPSYTIGEQGLIRHTKAAVAIAVDLFRADFYDFTDYDKDIVVSSLILHDGLKCGMWEDHTAFDHPLLMAERVREVGSEFAEDIAKCISSHMGKWTTSKYSDVVLPKPITNREKCVHLCDYLASRKHLIFDFDVYAEELTNE
jgi:hypothetical protein